MKSVSEICCDHRGRGLCDRYHCGYDFAVIIVSLVCAVTVVVVVCTMAILGLVCACARARVCVCEYVLVFAVAMVVVMFTGLGGKCYCQTFRALKNSIEHVVVLCFSRGNMLWAVTFVGVVCSGLGVSAQPLPTASVVIQGDNPKA